MFDERSVAEIMAGVSVHRFTGHEIEIVKESLEAAARSHRQNAAHFDTQEPRVATHFREMEQRALELLAKLRGVEAPRPLVGRMRRRTVSVDGPSGSGARRSVQWLFRGRFWLAQK